jgi:hypothetical protein
MHEGKRRVAEGKRRVPECMMSRGSGMLVVLVVLVIRAGQGCVFLHVCLVCEDQHPATMHGTSTSCEACHNSIPTCILWVMERPYSCELWCSERQSAFVATSVLQHKSCKLCTACIPLLWSSLSGVWCLALLHSLRC